jgi:cytochrome b561
MREASAKGPRRVLDRLHLWLAVFVVWLLVTSPWVSMLRRIPSQAGFFDHAHIGFGLAAAVLTVVYFVGCCLNGGWRLYFPWLAGEAGVVFRDLAGLVRGRIPAAEGGGLFGAIEGFTLVALLVVAATGTAWLWTAGTGDALDWRGHHIAASRALIGLIVLHAVSVSLHVLDFLRD